jgi:coenzyme F420-reducing hydrogenase beta subunit
MLDFNIVTFHGMNYGATLQAFALKSYLNELGYNAGVFSYKKTGLGLSGKSLKGRISSFLGSLNRSEADSLEKKNKFESFHERYLNLNEDGDSRIFLTGSDQVWNASRALDPTYFLRFVDNIRYRASYAASMGTDKIPNDKKDVFKRYIESLDKVSVREEGARKCIEEIYTGDISVNVDPTLLHDKEFYTDYTVPIKDIPDHYILAYILHIPKNANALLKWLKAELGYEIVLIDSGAASHAITHDHIVKTAGPEEFLWLFQNADAVVTTSFHGTAFSLIFEKEFYSIVNSAMPSRITNLLNLFGMKPVSDSEKRYERNDKVEWEKVRSALRKEKEKSREYLTDVYQSALQKTKKEYVGNVLSMRNECTGCAACEYSCPVNAISMSLNQEGFYEPAIDSNKCINCGKCIRICPLNKKMIIPKKKTYYGWSMKQEIILNSSSGGVFRSLADHILDQKGVVVAAIYSDDWRSVVFCDTDAVSVERMQKSKYTVSNPEGVYRRIRKYLDQNRKVLFCGTPCQCAALEAIFGHDNENLISCDFVCGGMPSLSFYREHLDWLENKYKSVITNLDFRPKDWGWGRHRLKVQFENGKKYIRREFADSYFCCFADKKISVRETCYECPYRHYHRADITIADFWGYAAAGIEKNKYGISLIVANSDRGQFYVESMSDFDLHEMDEKFARYAFMPKAPIESKVKARRQLFELARQKGFEAAATELYDFSAAKHYVRGLLKKAGISR